MFKKFIAITFLSLSLYSNEEIEVEKKEQESMDRNISINKFKELIVKGMEEKLEKLKEVSVEKEK